MNILITGCNGFLGRELIPLFESDGYNVIATNRDNLDVMDPEQVASFLNDRDVDVVIHTAVKGGRRNQPDTHINMFKNITMFENLRKNCSKYKLMINFGSGAEFDRTQDISNMTEEQIHERYPKDYYGLSKSIIAKQIAEMYTNIINFRLFGCFGAKEDSDRMIKASILKALDGKPIEIRQDREMDFFYVKDLYKVVTHYIENLGKNLPKDLNLCYSRKYSLMDVANTIDRVGDNHIKITVNDKEKASSYTGCGKKLEALDLELIGLKKGIKEVYDSIVEAQNVN